MEAIKIIKNRSDIGAGTRGSDMGIDAIEIAAINAGNDYFKTNDFHSRFIFIFDFNPHHAFCNCLKSFNQTKSKAFF